MSAIIAQVHTTSHTGPAMAAVLSEIKCVNFGALKATWKISKSEDIIVVNHEAFVRVNPTAYTLVQLVCEDNHNETHLYKYKHKQHIIINII